MPRKQLGEVMLAKQTSQFPTWIVRSGDRYGLRVEEKHIPDLHKLHRPDIEYLEGQTMAMYRVGPLPYGTTKQSLQKVFKEWSWKARAGQPQGQDTHGVMWTAQATEPPSHWVFTMGHGDLLITKLHSPKDKPSPLTSAPLTSHRTMQHLTAVSNKKPWEKQQHDPWTNDDPWLHATSKAGTGISPAQLSTIETNVEKRILAQLPTNVKPDDMEMEPDVDHRVSQLESQVQQLKETVQQASASMQSFQHQQAQQNQQLSQQVHAVKHQVDSQNHHLQSMIEGKLEEQMSRIESLLTKRMKTNEWQHGKPGMLQPLERTNQQMWSILLRGIQIRVGEALNPGPKPSNIALTIGAINPAGLGNKGTTLIDLPNHQDAIWGVCETHLTKPGIAKFNNELIIRRSAYKLHHGEPSPFRFETASSISGKHVGVGFLATTPSRRLVATWPSSQASEARFSMQTFFCQNRWIHGAACYGYAHKSETVAVRNQTDDLLESITQRIVYGMKGYRFIVGDFNQSHGTLHQTTVWERMGWKEIQVLWAEKFQRPIQPTCKSVSVKDFVWISPELIPYIEDIEVINHIYPDHAVPNRSG